MLSFIVANIPYYKGFDASNLMNFPVINKKTIIDNYESMLTPQDKIPGQRGAIHIQKTSGSTGTPFAVPQDTVCRIRRVTTIKYLNEALAFHSFDPMIHLRSFKHYYNYGEAKEWVKYNKTNNIYYVNNAEFDDERADKVIRLINDKRIKLIRGYMTTIDSLTRYAVSHQLELRYKPSFISCGELLPESLRKRIVEELHCRVVSQYANEENGVLGQSIINGPGSTILLHNANCIIEILKFDKDEPAEKGELGRIVVTDFINHALPMIRYDIGDVGAIGEVLENGLITRIDNLSGRKSDIVYKPNGEYIDVFNSISSNIYNSFDVLQWQFVQTGSDTYTLKIVPANKQVKPNASVYLDMMHKLLGEEANIKIEFPDEIPVLSSGKRKVVINEYKKS